MILQCVAIDDEPLARECIANYIREIDFLQLAGTGNNPLDIPRLLDQQTIDLIFLDIQMPVMNGIEFLKITPHLPMVIITTAYPSYALEGYQLDVLDYLVKPITFNRFFQAVNKAKDYYQLKERSLQQVAPLPATGADYFFIKWDYKYEKIYFHEVLFVEAMQNYVSIHTTKGKYITLLHMKNVEEQLNRKDFIRVHKSYLVAISKIESIENNEIKIQQHRIPISRNSKDAVIDRVVNDKLWKK